eukprot:scaffold19300_cov32-Attheya_sp.AAC.3
MFSLSEGSVSEGLPCVFTDYVIGTWDDSDLAGGMVVLDIIIFPHGGTTMATWFALEFCRVLCLWAVGILRGFTLKGQTVSSGMIVGSVVGSCGGAGPSWKTIGVSFATLGGGTWVSGSTTGTLGGGLGFVADA